MSKVPSIIVSILNLGKMKRQKVIVGSLTQSISKLEIMIQGGLWLKKHDPTMTSFR